MFLTGFVQRERLFDLATRWLANRMEPEDTRFVTQAFIYEGLIVRPRVESFMTDLGSALHAPPLFRHRIFSKDDYRQAIMEACPHPSPAVAELFARYRERPEEFYPHTPADIYLAVDDKGHLMGTARMKRVRRLAEKASRRVADRLLANVEDRARELARSRAMASGQLRKGEQVAAEPRPEEYTEAERQVAETFALREPVFSAADLRIDDVIGAKLIGPPEMQAAVEQAIREQGHVNLVEREEHRGAYNAVNLLVDMDLPPAGEIIDRMRPLNWSFAAGRGIPTEELARDFPEYVESGARSIRVELILTTFEDLVESEFGGSIHEARILAQRDGHYGRQIARNASYILEFLLTLAVSPTLSVEEIPFKIWGRYLPVAVVQEMWKLYGLQYRDATWDSFLYDPGSNGFLLDPEKARV